MCSRCRVLLLVLSVGLATSAHAAGPRVAILRDDLPGLGLAHTDALAHALREGGLSVTALTGTQLADAAALSTSAFDCLVLTHSPVYPATARDSILAFICAGGDLVLMGGHAFHTPVWRVGGKWITRDDVAAEVIRNATANKLLFDLDKGDLSVWRHGADNPKLPTKLSLDTSPVGKALRMDLKGVTWYDVFGADVAGGIPAEHGYLSLWAKGDALTPQLFVEVTEKDGTRWSRAVNVSTDWRPYLVPPASFLFKADGAPPGRGAAGDHLNLANAARITFGLACDRNTVFRGDHTLWVARIASLAAETPAGLDSPPLQLNAFDDYEPYALNGIQRAVPAPGQTLVGADTRFTGAFEGTSAIGFGFPDESTSLPVLSAKDRYGRTRGWATGMLVNYGGEFRGSNWLLFGLTTSAFYGDKAFAPMLAKLISGMRGDDLAKSVAAGNARLCDYKLPLTAPAPAAFLRPSADRRHYLLPDGRRLFAIGADYIGSLDRKFSGGSWLRWLEEDFHKCHDAGINAMRIYGGGSLFTDRTKLAALKQCARKYGVYMLVVVVDHTDLLTKDELVARAKTIARAFRDEPMLLGYDLQNEPYAYELAKIRDGGVSLGEKHPAWAKWGEYEKWAGIHGPGETFTTFPGVTGPLQADEAHRAALADTDSIFGDWIRWQVEAIRAVDSNHGITVGYNSDFACLPANKQLLDFVAHHGYQTPDSLQGVMRNLTTFDRLRAVDGDRPIFFGEFGYTNGMSLGGKHLDLYTSAVGEMMNWLYAWANGYDGCLKWALTDHPLALSLRQAPWMPREDLTAHIDQGRFGLYWYDGTFEGRPKPIVWALRFLREYIDAGGDSGKLEVRTGSTIIGTAYAYQAPQALFVGDLDYRAPGLDFHTLTGKPANVMLRWDDKQLRVLSTCDARLRINPSVFVPALTASHVKVTGKVGAMRREGDNITIEALEGETVVLGPPS